MTTEAGHSPKIILPLARQHLFLAVMPQIDADDLQSLLNKEWLVTNGTGGYSSSTICGANTRRYHGVLVAATNPPAERKIFVSKVEEAVTLGGQTFRLSTNEYPDVFYPEGYRYLHYFSRTPLPTSTFKIGQAILEKTVFMVNGSNTTVIEYHNRSPFELPVWINPLFVYRDFHKVEMERGDHKYFVKYMGHTQSIRACEGAEKLYFKHTHGIFRESRCWNKNLQYRVDKERGNEYSEDLYSVGYLENELPAGESMYLVFTLDAQMCSKDPAQLKAAELSRLDELVTGEHADPFVRDLIRSADQFMVHRASTGSSSVIAGYHWFGDWGRDAMIAIRGLCIATGRQEEARSVISTFLHYLNGGLIPNRFPDYDGEELEYNTADATLWLFVALHTYFAKFEDAGFLAEVLPKLKEIIEAHVKGTHHQIRVLDNGLLSGGAPDIQITWMDARLHDKVFTPRNGCAVEINALWYNALMIYNELVVTSGQPEDKKLKALSAKCRREFNLCFWNEAGYLNDVWSPGHTDTSIRPNQVFALSLPYSLLIKKREKLVLENISRHLLSPYGLRTLSPDHPDFKPEYSGDWYSRDESYHQGTVWPFLLPEYFSACLKVNGRTKKNKKEIAEFLRSLKDHFYENECLHGISEVFDGQDPQRGKGCAQQAWSISNLLKLLIEEEITVT